MNKQEVINKINGMTVETFFSGTLFVKQKEVIKLIEQLDECSQQDCLTKPTQKFSRGI